MAAEVGQPIRLVSPITGEILELDSPTDKLGGLLADIREHESMVKELKSLVNGELLRRMDRAASWTVYASGMKLSAPSSKPPEEFDGAKLREALLALVDSGDLAIEAVDAAVEVVVDYKVHKSGINALRKREDTRAIVDAYASEVEKPRYVSVSRA